MATHYNVRTVTDGLVLALDAANSKSFDSAENLLTYSEQFDNVAWSTEFSTFTANSVVSPNGTTTADTFTASSNTAFVYRTFSASTQTYTFSCFAKAGTAASFRLDFVTASYGLGGSCIFDLSAGTAGTVTFYGSSTGFTASVQNFSNGWYRCSISGASTATTWYPQITLVNSSGNNIYIWGAQLEIGASPASSYYATSGTIKTRGTTWTDLSGNGNTGTLTNGPTYNSANGGSLVFNGSTSYINVPNSANFAFGSGDLSVEAMIYLTGYSSNWSGYYTAVLATQDGTGGRAWIFQVTGTSSSWTNLIFGNFTTNVTATQTFSLNTWYHLVVSKIGTSTQLYANGVATGASVNVGAIPITTDSLTIGRESVYWSNAGYSYALPGRLSFARIYKGKGLTASEVSQNYNALKSRYV